MNLFSKIRRSALWIVVSCLPGLALSCRKPEPPEYYGFQDLRVGKAIGQQTTVATTLKLYNPNHFNLQLQQAEMDIYLNGKLSGHSLLDSTIFIPQKDTFFVPVSLQLDLRTLFSNALQLLLEKQVKIALDGKARLKRGGIPFTVPFHYEANQDLNSLLPSAGY